MKFPVISTCPTFHWNAKNRILYLNISTNLLVLHWKVTRQYERTSGIFVPWPSSRVVDNPVFFPSFRGTVSEPFWGWQFFLTLYPISFSLWTLQNWKQRKAAIQQFRGDFLCNFLWQIGKECRNYTVFKGLFLMGGVEVSKGVCVEYRVTGVNVMQTGELGDFTNLYVWRILIHFRIF